MRRILQNGFTLIEIVIVLAMIGLLTLLIVAGAGTNIKNERFSGEVKQFADNLRQAQTHGFTTQTGQNGCPGGSQPAPGSFSSVNNTCYWRGVMVRFNTSGSTDQHYWKYLLYGGDISNYSSNTDPQVGIIDKVLDQTNSTNQMMLCNILIDGSSLLTPNRSLCSGPSADYGWVSQYDLAFLAPNGVSYGCHPLVAANCDPTANPKPYVDQGRVVFVLADSGTSLTAIVTFDLQTGTISTKVD